MGVSQPNFSTNDDEGDEEPRQYKVFKINRKEESVQSIGPDLQEEVENVKNANSELKDTIQKLMETHLVEKKRMLVKLEEETTNYVRYYQFYHDNFEKIGDMTFKMEEMKLKIDEMIKLQDKQKQQLQEQKDQQDQNSSKTSCDTCERYTGL